mgnify:CR=1 FL=1
MPLVVGADNSKVCKSIGFTNDARAISDVEREKRLTALGKDAGIAFTFVD